jgi:signal transduction histidine kinase
MQGRVSVASHEGKGSTFCVDLPLAASTNGS